MKKLVAATIAATLFVTAQSSQASTLNQTFDVSVTLNAACRVQGGPIANPVLNFGTYTAFSSATTPTPTATFALECTRDLAAPTFTFTDGTSYGVIAGLNYNVTPTSTVTTAGTAASATLNGIGSADVRTITLTGDMPVCFTCHQDKRADIFRFSTHPLRTGFMTCSSCHAPHGSATEPNLVRNTINETCYSCHADKRGPFLWEHPPVRENCAECHNPHGSNNSHLLTVRGPYLCQQCHAAPQHPSSFYDGRVIPQGQPPGGNFSRMLGQNCANCHSKVHGSNHPSGQRFTR